MAMGRSAVYAMPGQNDRGDQMFKRLKTALVDSYVGAIALGYLVAEGFEQIAAGFLAPFSEWIQLRALHYLTPQVSPEPKLNLVISLPHFFYGVFYEIIAFVLLRWLYFPAKVKELTLPVEEADAP
jgi:hypothetical protein